MKTEKILVEQTVTEYRTIVLNDRRYARRRGGVISKKTVMSGGSIPAIRVDL